jgi:hypothetical protein
MVIHIQTPESALQPLIVNIMWYPQRFIEVSCSTQLVVGFVDGICQVGENNEDVDSLSIADVAWRARSRFRIASADEDCVKHGLKVAGHKLKVANQHP